MPDASEAWHSFHPRSERARNLLKTLSSRPYVPAKDAKKKFEHVTTETEPVVQDFIKLREDLVAEVRIWTTSRALSCCRWDNIYRRIQWERGRWWSCPPSHEYEERTAYGRVPGCASYGS